MDSLLLDMRDTNAISGNYIGLTLDSASLLCKRPENASLLFFIFFLPFCIFSIFLFHFFEGKGKRYLKKIFMKYKNVEYICIYMYACITGLCVGFKQCWSAVYTKTRFCFYLIIFIRLSYTLGAGSSWLFYLIFF